MHATNCVIYSLKATPYKDLLTKSYSIQNGFSDTTLYKIGSVQ